MGAQKVIKSFKGTLYLYKKIWPNPGKRIGEEKKKEIDKKVLKEKG